MSSEELERSLRSEIETYLDGRLNALQIEVSRLQSQVNEAFSGFLERASQKEAAPAESSIAATISEHLRTAHEHGLEAGAAETTVQADPAAETALLNSAVAEVDNQRSQADVLNALVNRAADFAPRLGLFVVRHGHAQGWRARGLESAGGDESVRQVALSLSDEHPVAEACRTCSVWSGAPGTNAHDYLLVNKFGGEPPQQMAALPLVIRNKAVAVLYADSGTEDAGALKLPALETLMRVAGMSVELLAVTRGAARPVATVEPKAPAAEAETAPVAEAEAPAPAAPAREVAASPASGTVAEAVENPVPAPVAEAVENPVPAPVAEVAPPVAETPAVVVAEEVAPPMAEEQPEPESIMPPEAAPVYEETPEAPAGYEEQPVAPPVFAVAVEEPAVVASEPPTAAVPSFPEEVAASSFEIAPPPVFAPPAEEIPPPPAPQPQVAVPNYSFYATPEPDMDFVSPPVFETTYPVPAVVPPAVPESASWMPPVAPEPAAWTPPPPMPVAPPPAPVALEPLPPPPVAETPSFADSPTVSYSTASSYTGPLGSARTYGSQIDLPIEVADDERRLHNDARRFARLLVSEIKLYNEPKVREGRDAGDIYVRLREAIDRSRQMYDKRVAPPVASRFDYFHYELVNTLAEGDPAKLGPDYPGASA